MTVEPGKNFLGQRGFPTPNSIPETSACRTFRVPADDEWLGLLMAAAMILTEEWAYYQWGELTPSEAAAAWQDIINQTYDGSFVDGCPSTPAPYWQDNSADDADDDAPPDDQPWYGEIVAETNTWQEQVGIWAITAFIALTATPAAAVAFLPFANRFVLAFKQHSVGAIVKVLIDGVELVKVDTYAPTDGVISVPISLPAPSGFRAFDTTPVMWVMMTDETNPAVTGTPNMQLIRKRLDVTDVTPANIRWNAECDCVQQSPDGGTTWIDSPSQDPRSSTIFQVPARTGDDPRCDSAQQMHDRIKHMLDAIIASSDILQAINSVVAVIAIFFFEVGVVIEAVWAIVSAIFSVGTTTLAAALTEDQYDLLLCILYCHIGGDGTVTADQFATIKTQVSAQLNATAAFAINQALDSIGFVGLTNAGALGEVTGDCSACDCGWCFVEDLTVTDGGYETLLGQARGEWIDGTGWRFQVFEGTALCQIEKSFTSATITSIDVLVDVASVAANAIELPEGTQVVSSNLTGIDVHVGWEGSKSADSVFYNFQSSCTIKQVTWHGLGECPFGTPNC